MSTIYQNYKPLVERDNLLFVRGNTKGFQTEGAETGVAEIVGANNNPGAWSDVPAVIAIAHNFGEATQPGNIRSIDAEALFNFAGTTTIATNASISAIRGCASVASGTTLGNGTAVDMVYGVEGKFVLQGTTNVSATGVAAALKGVFDTSATGATATSGYNAALHLDMGTSSTITTSTVINAASITNTTNLLINSVIKVVANANFLFDLAESTETGNWLVGTTASTAAGCIKVKVNGATRYIQLFSAEA
jgi:hypothetical protein